MAAVGLAVGLGGFIATSAQAATGLQVYGSTFGHTVYVSWHNAGIGGKESVQVRLMNTANPEDAETVPVSQSDSEYQWFDQPDGTYVVSVIVSNTSEGTVTGSWTTTVNTVLPGAPTNVTHSTVKTPVWSTTGCSS